MLARSASECTRMLRFVFPVITHSTHLTHTHTPLKNVFWEVGNYLFSPLLPNHWVSTLRATDSYTLMDKLDSGGSEHDWSSLRSSCSHDIDDKSRVSHESYVFLSYDTREAFRVHTVFRQFMCENVELDSVAHVDSAGFTCKDLLGAPLFFFLGCFVLRCKNVEIRWRSKLYVSPLHVKKQTSHVKQSKANVFLECFTCENVDFTCRNLNLRVMNMNVCNSGVKT